MGFVEHTCFNTSKLLLHTSFSLPLAQSCQEKELHESLACVELFVCFEVLIRPLVSEKTAR